MTQWTKYSCGLVLVSMLSVAGAGQDLDARARELTERYPVVDTHIDVPYRVHGSWVDVTQATDNGQFDYPRAVKGGLNVPFMSIYTPAEDAAADGNHQLAHQLIDSVEAMVAREPGRFMMIHSVADVQKAMEQGKIGLAMGMENGSPINGKLENIGVFAQRGIRYITLAHSLSNGISDSSFDENRPLNGLSDFGRDVVREMNRAGVMVDVSHVSDEAFWQVLEITEVPVIASHSSVRHFVPGFERNMSDDMIKALAKNGGVIQINFGSAFIEEKMNKVMTEFRAERKAFLEENGYTSASPEYQAYVADFLKRNPDRYTSLEKVVDHFDHVIGLVGPDHVGIGSDYDGVGDSLPTGLKDVASYPNLVAEFLRRGYSEHDITKILGGNLLRVWRETEAYANAR
jgi:membrane dipeptidase